MPAYLLETARSFPNPINGEEYNTTWKDPPAVTMRVTPLVTDLARAQITLLPLRVVDLDPIL